MNGVEVELTGMSVLLAMPIHRPIHHKVAMSLLRTIQATTAAGIRCNVMFDAAGLIELARNGILNDFVHGDQDKLFWVDSDIVWEPEQFFKMLALSKLYDVVGATYPAKVEGEPQTFVRMFDEKQEPNEHGLTRVKGMGLGFTVMDREVLMRVIRGKPRVRDAIKDEWVVWAIRSAITDGNDMVGEDMALFEDIRLHGYDVWLDGSMKLGHIGDREWRFPDRRPGD